MFDQDKWQEIFHALSKNKLRTFLTALGVGWGIFMLLIMLGAGKGLENGVKSGFVGFATNSIFIWTRSTSIPYKGFPQGRRFRLDNDDIPALRKMVPEIDLIAPRNQLGGHRGGNNVSRNNKSGAFSVNGDYPEIKDIQGIKVKIGRFIDKLDLIENRKIAVIGSRVYEVLFDEGEDPIGKNIKIKGVYFKVVGMFSTAKTGDQGERDTQTIFVPFSTFQKAFNFGNKIGWFAITANENVSCAVVEEKVLAILASRHRISPDDDRAFGHVNVQERFEMMSNLFLGINGLSWFVGYLTLFAGVIGISNIMLMIVKERTKEIGIRRALGATPANIISEIILESVILTTIAGYFGLIAGVAVIEIAGKFVNVESFKNPEINLNIALIALAVLIVSGIFAGLIPANRAISIKPVEAIKAE